MERGSGGGGRGWGARDAVVLLSILLVSAAIGTGLALEGGLEPVLALVGGVASFFVLLLLHIAARRIGRRTRLRDRIEPRAEIAMPEFGDEDRPLPVASEQDLEAFESIRQQIAHPERADLGEDFDSIDARDYATSVQTAEPPRGPPMLAPSQRAENPMAPEADFSFDSIDDEDRAPARSEIAPQPVPTAPPMPPITASPPRAVVAEAPNPIDIIVRAAREGSVEVHLQPVYSLDQRKVRFYEVFPRLRTASGGLLQELSYVTVAQQAGVLSAIERATAVRTVQILRKLVEIGKARAMFYGISLASLRDSSLLHVLHEMMRGDQSLAEYLIFELAYPEFVKLTPTDRESILALTQAGFSFSLDRVTMLDIDLRALMALRVSFVKISAELVSRDPTGAVTLMRDLHQAQIDLVVDGIRTEQALARATELGLMLGQGPALSEPRPIRPEVLGAGTVAAAGAGAPAGAA